jgi:hypothetical protein
MLAESRLSGLATCIRLAHMRTHATIPGSELLLSVIATRLAALVLVGWVLTLLPPRAGDGQTVCRTASAMRTEAQQPATTVGPRVVGAAFDDMHLHD